MATQDGGVRLRVQIPGSAICPSCGVELGSYEKLRGKKKTLQIENSVLQQRLREASYVNETNEARISSFNAQREEVIKLGESVSNYQRSLASQQKALESKEMERALAAQSLTYEFKCHEATERSLEQERALLLNIVRFLDTLDIPRRADLDDNTGIGTLWLNSESMKARLEQLDGRTKILEEELQEARNVIQHKQYLLEDLSDNYKIEPQSTSMPPISESSGEENEVKATVVVSNPGKQRKRTRN